MAAVEAAGAEPAATGIFAETQGLLDFVDLGFEVCILVSLMA